MVHIITYDFAGTVLASGAAKPCRTSGLVTHTHQLLTGLSRIAPRLRLALTHTGAGGVDPYYLRTDAGQVVLVQGIATEFRDYLATPGRSGQDPARVRHFYEDQIGRVDNPVYRSLARQYAHVIRVAGTPHVLAQNLDPIVSTLKAEELGYLTAERAGQLTVTGVVPDITGAPHRFDYLAQRLVRTGHKVRLIAVSNAVRATLLAAGVPEHQVHTVPNGLDVGAFRRRLQDARRSQAFEKVRSRNGLPGTGTMILLSARRVAWKGHGEVIEAVKILTRRGITDFFVVFNGNRMIDTRDPDYEFVLARRIRAARLEDRIFLLDDLSPIEVAACYDAAAIAVHPSRRPEAWGYANIEAMLAETAVIAAGHGAPLDYLEPGQSGLLVPPGDPAVIADAIARLLSDPVERARLARRGQVVASQFTVEAMATGYYRVIAGQSPTAPHAALCPGLR